MYNGQGEHCGEQAIYGGRKKRNILITNELKHENDVEMLGFLKREVEMIDLGSKLNPTFHNINVSRNR